MRVKWNRVFFLLFILLAVFAAAILFINRKTSETDMISWYVLDGSGDEADQLLVITKSDSSEDMTLDTGEPYGSFLEVYSDFEIVRNRPVFSAEADHTFDLTQMKPLKVQAGDVDGDGEAEIAVCVYKTTKYHPVLAKRPFFYRIKDGVLEPVWLGSRLARPFDDYILSDVDLDGIEEIVSIERLENGDKVVAAYDWKGFGFEVKTLSEEWKGEAVFLNPINGKEDEIRIDIAGDHYQLIVNEDKIRLSRYE